MSEFERRCPNCGEALLGITSAEEIASCPSCGLFFERLRPVSRGRWPAVWKLALALCGPMLAVVLMRAGQWIAFRSEVNVLGRVFAEAYRMCLPLAWFGWPLVGAYLLARRYAALPDRWMSYLGLVAGGLIGNTALNLVSMLLQVIV